jgi:hypothetical protein
MPLGLVALVAVGIHAAADLVDDRLLFVAEALDARFDALAAQWELTSSLTERFGSAQSAWLARALTLGWELLVDLLVALPMLGYSEEVSARPGPRRDRWRALLARLVRRPTPMRVLRPSLVACFVLGGAYAVSRLVESTVFVALAGDVASVRHAAPLARFAGAAAMALVLASHGWRAVLRALEHADTSCAEAERGAERSVLGGARSRRAFASWTRGSWGTTLAAPLAVALVLEARALLSFFL